MRPILLPLALAAATQAQLVTFSAGSPAKAADVNGNFAYIAARLDSIAKAVAAKDTVIASMGKRMDAGIPKGTIAAFLTAPGIDAYLPNSDQSWVIAAGQGTVNDISIPDLRGQFLRGIDLTVTGAKDTAYDPDGKRASGNPQADAFQGHVHSSWWPQSGGYSNAGLTIAGRNSESGAKYLNVGSPVSDDTNGTPRTAKETRPKNVAVYWYIKVK